MSLSNTARAGSMPRPAAATPYRERSGNAIDMEDTAGSVRRKSYDEVRCMAMPETYTGYEA